MTSPRPLSPASVGDEFWGRGWFWCLLALLSTAPFVIAPLPMMPDYFSHIGRYHVMNHGRDSAWLRQYYAFHWTLIGNLGVDLLMVPLGRLLPTETAASIAAGMIPPLTIAGIHAVTKAVWGRIEAPALLALPFVYSFTFLYGFVNYHLAVALALLALAGWIRSGAWPAWRRWLVFLPVAAVLWIAHIAGWAVFLLLIGCWEVASARRAGAGLFASVRSAAIRCLPVALPLGAILAWRSDSGGTRFYLEDLLSKLDWVRILLRSEVMWLDLATMAVMLVVGFALLREPTVRRDPRLMLGAAALFICFLLLPLMVLGSFFADGRLLPVMAMVFFMATAVPGRVARLVALTGLALFGVRLTMTTVGWHTRGTAAVADLKALDGVPQGSRIAVMATPTGCEQWQLQGLDHLASLAIVRREAFVNTQWDIAGSQLMRPIHNQGRGFNEATTTRMVGRAAPCEGSTLASMLAALPRDRFDYVWVFDARADVPWLVPVHAGPHGRLYAIRTTP